jgi:hypothetical protein
MATYVNDLRLKEITTGDESGTWGTSTNTNLELIAEAFSYGTEVITTNADTHTTTIADGASNPGRSLYLKYTGTLDSACTITIGPNTVSKVWIIENGTSGSQNIIISQGSGADITIPAGDTKVVYSDGAGAGAAFFDAFASLSVVDLKVQDDLTVTGDIDVDGTTNLDVVDIDGAVDMATTLAVAGNVDFNGDLDVDGTTNLDIVDIDGAVDMASTLDVTGAITAGSGTLSGNLQIQAASSSAKLTVGDLGDTDRAAAFSGGSILLDGGAAFDMIIGDGNVAYMSITTTDDATAMKIRDFSGTADLVTIVRASGNVGIGTTSPAAKIEIGTAQNTTSQFTNPFIKLLPTATTNTTGFTGITYGISDADNYGWSVGGLRTGADASVGAFVFNSHINSASGTERMRISSSGEVNLNNTFTGSTLNVLATGSDTSNWCQRYYTTGTESELYVVDFIDYQGQRVGYITNNPVGNTTAYVTSSDYRLKENVDYTWDATTRLKQLKPARFNWIRDESNTLVDGFLAHEVEDIVPEAISGEKDATETKTNAVVNSYGNYIADNVTEEEWLAGKEDGTYDADTTWAASHTQNFYQGIDQAKLVPLLVKTIQELEARITTLENA